MPRAICSTWLNTASARDSLSLITMQRADALAVQAQILGVRYGDQRLGQHLREQANPGGIGLEVHPESLIGQIEERREPPPLQQIPQDPPLGRVEVRAGRVVAAGVHQHHIALACKLQALEHRVETQLDGPLRRNTDNARA